MTDLGRSALGAIHEFKRNLIGEELPSKKNIPSREKRKAKNRARAKVQRASRKANRAK